MLFLASWHKCIVSMSLGLLVLLLATRKVTAMVGAVTQTLPPSLVREHPTVHATFWPLMANWCQTLSWRRVPLPPLRVAMVLPHFRRVCRTSMRLLAWLLWLVCPQSEKLPPWSRMLLDPTLRIYVRGHFMSSQQTEQCTLLDQHQCLHPPPLHLAAQYAVIRRVVHTARAPLLAGARLCPAAQADSCAQRAALSLVASAAALSAPSFLSACERQSMPKMLQLSWLLNNWSTSSLLHCFLVDRAPFRILSASEIGCTTFQAVVSVASSELSALCGPGKNFAPGTPYLTGAWSVTSIWLSGLRVRVKTAAGLSPMTEWTGYDGLRTTWTAPSTQPRIPAAENPLHHPLARSLPGPRCWRLEPWSTCSESLYYTQAPAAGLCAHGLQPAIVTQWPRCGWSMDADPPPHSMHCGWYALLGISCSTIKGQT